jgi:hypothetical protein
VVGEAQGNLEVVCDGVASYPPIRLDQRIELDA